jgi:signal transduction histidine kinase
VFGKTLGAILVTVGIVSVGVVVGLGHGDLLLDQGIVHVSLLAAGTGILALLTMDTEARNGAVWALIWSGFFAALTAAGMTTVIVWAHDTLPGFDAEAFNQLAPADLPFAIALALEPLAWAWIPATMLAVTVGLLLFPDGRPPSPRWRYVAWFSLATIVLASVAYAWMGSPNSTITIGEDSPDAYGVVGQIGGAALAVVMLAVVASIAGLVVRYRRSTGATRRQIRWIALGGAIFAASLFWLMVSEFIGAGSGIREAAAVLVAEAVLILCFVVAITRFRLYDIDVVISRTLTYGVLAVFITAVYVAMVVGIGGLIGRGNEPDWVLAIGATAAVALLFEPIRSRVQRWANRLVYGTRATPYEVLARFSTRAATAQSDAEVLERIPRLIVDGTGATKATLWTTSGDELHPTAWWPEEDAPPAPLEVVDGSWSDPTSDYSVAVEHQGELLGGLSLVAGRGETIAPAEVELVHNLAGGLGLALRNARLTEDLVRQVDQLADSRERILSAADEARRDLERDLDMGPQQELVAVKVKLGVVKSRAEAANATRTAEVLAQLEHETGSAIDSVRDFSRGVYPPLLEAEGLAAAISAEADKAAVPVEIDTAELRRYSREVETAVFFSVLEALQNAAKYADPSAVTVRLVDDGSRLSFEVHDDGRGFDPAMVDGGSGIPGMMDRLDAADGAVSLESAPGRGTSVKGWVPLSPVVAG